MPFVSLQWSFRDDVWPWLARLLLACARIHDMWDRVLLWYCCQRHVWLLECWHIKLALLMQSQWQMMVIQISPSGGGEGAGCSEWEVAEFQRFKLKLGCTTPVLLPPRCSSSCSAKEECNSLILEVCVPILPIWCCKDTHLPVQGTHLCHFHSGPHHLGMAPNPCCLALRCRGTCWLVCHSSSLSPSTPGLSYS